MRSGGFFGRFAGRIEGKIEVERIVLLLTVLLARLLIKRPLLEKAGIEGIVAQLRRGGCLRGKGLVGVMLRERIRGAGGTALIPARPAAH